MFALQKYCIILFFVFATLGLGSKPRSCLAYPSRWNTSLKLPSPSLTHDRFFRRYTTAIYAYEYCGTLAVGTAIDENGNQYNMQSSGVLAFSEETWNFFWVVKSRAPVLNVMPDTHLHVVPQLASTSVLSRFLRSFKFRLSTVFSADGLSLIQLVLPYSSSTRVTL